MPPFLPGAPACGIIVAKRGNARHRFGLHFPVSILQFCKISKSRAAAGLFDLQRRLRKVNTKARALSRLGFGAYFVPELR